MSYHVNKTWILITSLLNKSLVVCKWIFMVKETISSSEPFKFKARLIAKRFLQVEMVDYNEFFFSHVVKYTTIRIVLALITHFN